MKATGMIRRIDELGRIVVPKELRKNIRVKEGTPIEIFTNSDGRIILKKHSLVQSIQDFAKGIADSLQEELGIGTNISISDEESIVAKAGGKIPQHAKYISEIMEAKKMKEEEDIIGVPIMFEQESVGCILVQKSQNWSSGDERILQFAAKSISKQMS
jgi:AbrB family transcriptional regulator, stage V sporulation protein T